MISVLKSLHFTRHLSAVLYILLFLILISRNYAFSTPLDSNYKAIDSLKYLIGELELKKGGANYHNYSEPEKINFEVTLWGGVRSPGRYLIPKGTTLFDILTLSGGPNKEDFYEYIKIFRTEGLSGDIERKKVININYNDFYSKEIRNTKEFVNPVLQPGDIIILPIESDKTIWDKTRDVLAFITPLISLVILVIQISNLNK